MRLRILFKLCLISFFFAIICACSKMGSGLTMGTRAHASFHNFNNVHHIALLLPLQGPLAPYATAIRNGFFTAYYQHKEQTGTAPVVTVYNTAGKDVTSVYQQAITEGADVVVGPLDKNAVEVLSHTPSLPVPVIALNSTALPSTNRQFLEFALSPTDEAKQAALKMLQDNHRAVVIIASQNTLGQRIANAFTQAFQVGGGHVVVTQFYNGMPTLAKNIRLAFQVRNKKTVEPVLNRTQVLPEHRQDVDGIFIAATPPIAAQIQNLLRFYFIDNIPVYATSQVYSANASHNHALKGIYVCNMPWIIAPDQLSDNLKTMQQHIQQMWPDHYDRLAKFYAMGVDAFRLTQHLNDLSSGFPSATGTLYLTSQNDIERKLLWTQM